MKPMVTLAAVSAFFVGAYFILSALFINAGNVFSSRDAMLAAALFLAGLLVLRIYEVTKK